MKRILALFFVIVMLGTLFVSCNADDDGDSENPKGPQDTEGPYDANGYLKDDLPKLDFGDETVTILYWNDGEHDEFNIKNSSDDMLKNSIYYRNVTTEERLGIKLDFVGTPGWDTPTYVNTVNQDILSGLYSYDILASFSMTIASCATSGLCDDLMKSEYINFDQPWWPKRLTEEATINRKLYFASGDISTSALYEMYMVFYNIDMFEDNNINEDPVALALDGKWTFDKLYEYAAVVGYQEMTNDGVANDGDIFGFILEDATIDPIFFAADLKMFSHNNMGSISVDESCFGQRAATFIDDFNRFLHSSGDAYFRAKTSDLSARTTGEMFSRGEALMTIGRACWARDIFANTEGLEYGILPVPKASENQEDYVSALYARDSFYAISSGCTIKNIASATLECMASESYRQVTPVLFETIMKLRYSPTAASSQVYDIVRESISFDLSRIYHRALQSKPLYYFRDAIKDNTSWGANAANNKKQLNRLIQDYILSKIA